MGPVLIPGERDAERLGLLCPYMIGLKSAEHRLLKPPLLVT